MLAKNVRFFLFIASLCFSFSTYAENGTNELLRKKSDPVAGNPRGNVTLVEFFDYQCSHCANMVSSINSLIRKNRNLRVVFKEYPILSPESQLAAKAALAANLQGKYYAFNRAIFSTNFISEDSLISIAKSLDLNINKFKHDMAGKEVANQIQSNYNLGREIGLTGTPAVFVAPTNAQNITDDNGFFGEVSESELQTAINKMTP